MIVLTIMYRSLVYRCRSPNNWFTRDDLVPQRNIAYPGLNKPLRAERNMTEVLRYFKPTFCSLLPSSVFHLPPPYFISLNYQPWPARVTIRWMNARAALSWRLKARDRSMMYMNQGVSVSPESLIRTLSWPLLETWKLLSRDFALMAAMDGTRFRASSLTFRGYQAGCSRDPAFPRSLKATTERYVTLSADFILLKLGNQ